MTEPIETSKARCKSRPEREAAGPDEATTQAGAPEASAHQRTTEASAHPAAKAPTHAATEASAYHCAAKASASHSAAKASSHHPAVKAATPAAEAPAPTSAHTRIRCGRYCHRAREGDGRQHNYDLTDHSVPPLFRENFFRNISSPRLGEVPDEGDRSDGS
jgi:hypothetical protein